MSLLCAFSVSDIIVLGSPVYSVAMRGSRLVAGLDSGTVLLYDFANISHGGDWVLNQSHAHVPIEVPRRR
jgi:hypothetical protein